MKFCPVQCLSGSIDEDGNQAEMNYDMAACAEMTQQYETISSVMKELLATDSAEEREAMIHRPDVKTLWYKMSVGSGGLLAQCFECMRVCPIATKAPLADPILRLEAAEAEAEAAESGAAE